MKQCRDCFYYVFTDGFQEVLHACRHPDIEYDGYLVSTAEARGIGGACGKFALLWEPIPPTPKRFSWWEKAKS